MVTVVQVRFLQSRWRGRQRQHHQKMETLLIVGCDVGKENSMNVAEMRFCMKFDLNLSAQRYAQLYSDKTFTGRH